MATPAALIPDDTGAMPAAEGADCELVTVDATRARRVAVAALVRAGAPEEHARIQADLLVDAELSGVSSHGLLRLERVIERIGNGVADPRARGRHHWARGALLSVDGERGLGPVVVTHAIAAALERIADTGVVAISIANNNHIGKLGFYAQAIAEKGYAAILLSTSEALVHPWGGRAALIGTNPIAIGVPTTGDPFVVDAATSMVSMGKIHDHANRGAAIPRGWALDAQGNPTTDAQAAKDGAIAPFGEGKGYALGLAFEVLVAALTDCALGADVKGTLDSDAVCNKGDVAIIIDPGAKGVAGRIAAYLDLIRASPAALGFDTVLVPGDRAARTREKRLAHGIALPRRVWETLLSLGGHPSGQE